MKTKTPSDLPKGSRLAGYKFRHTVLGIAVAVASATSAFAAPGVTAYNAGDLLIGFRLPGDSDNVIVNLGSIRNFVTSATSSDGLWDGSLKLIQLGIIPLGEPGGGTTVTSLSNVLTEAFGLGWATNELADASSDVSWAVAATTSATDNETLNGFNGNTNFISKAETSLGTVTTLPNKSSSTVNGSVNTKLTTIGSAFALKDSSLNLNTARVSPDSETGSWASGIGIAGGNSFNGTWNAEQDLTGAAAGPTNSILDLILDPKTSAPTSQAANTNQYLGSFRITEDGSLYYGSAAAVAAVPEPGTWSMLALGGALAAYVFNRKRLKSA